MKITELLNINSINLNAKASSKIEAIDNLVSLMENSGNLKDAVKYKEGILAREAQSTTGIGDEIAIPHAKTAAVKSAGLSSMVVRDGVDYESLDGAPTKLFFMIAAPDSSANVHLDVLSKLSTLIMTPGFKDSLLNAKTPEEFISIIDKAEAEKFDESKDSSKNDNTSENNSKYRVLAVTACPTGIAHTFMAAEALENKAKEKGISIKVETNGSSGAKNVLTKEDIQNAECIIVAADKKVEMARFNGKKVIQTKVANGIKNPAELLEQAISGKAEIYKSSSDTLEEKSSEQESIGRQIYKHLMNGVSHMLPFVIGGGILIALAFLLDNYEIDPSNFGSNTPVAAFFKSIGDTAFGFMLPILAGYIAMSIGDRPALAMGFVGGALASASGSGFLGALIAGFMAGYLAVLLKNVFKILPQSLEGMKPILIYPVLGILLTALLMQYIINPPVSIINISLSDFLNNMGGSSKLLLGFILGAMMSIDFGGPINKAAYVFGTAQLAEGNYDIMAAVMIGGMVPPIAISLASVIFKSKFTEKERQSWISNLIMGFAFISEAAIPFAASDPLRVIPSCAIGAGVAGALSMMFDCTLRAPHGGIFVVPVIGNPLMFIVALLVGSVVSTVILGFARKRIN